MIWPHFSLGLADLCHLRVHVGSLPVDLSLIVLAREGGEDYIFSLLTGYCDPPAGIEIREGLVYNAYFLGGAIGMPQQLFDGSVEYEDGKSAREVFLAGSSTVRCLHHSSRHSCHCQPDGKGCLYLPQMGQWSVLVAVSAGKQLVVVTCPFLSFFFSSFSPSPSPPFSSPSLSLTPSPFVRRAST